MTAVIDPTLFKGLYKAIRLADLPAGTDKDVNEDLEEQSLEMGKLAAEEEEEDEAEAGEDKKEHENGAGHKRKEEKVTGYENADQLCADLEEVVDVLWFSGTRE